LSNILQSTQCQIPSATYFKQVSVLCCWAEPHSCHILVFRRWEKHTLGLNHMLYLCHIRFTEQPCRFSANVAAHLCRYKRHSFCSALLSQLALYLRNVHTIPHPTCKM
jgi:hypothetical protein